MKNFKLMYDNNETYKTNRIDNLNHSFAKYHRRMEANELIFRDLSFDGYFLLSDAIASICFDKKDYAHKFLTYASDFLRLHCQEKKSFLINFDGKIAYSIYASILLRDKQTQALYNQVKLVLHENTYYPYRLAYVYADMLQALCSGNGAQILEAIDFFLLFQRRERDKEALVRQNRANKIYKNHDEYYQEDLTTPYSTGTPSYCGEGDETEMLKVPFVLVLKSIFEQDEQGFNQNLRIALEKHYNFYENYERVRGESLRDLPEGWVSLPLTVACAIAHDKGMKREIESDYIPEWLVKGEFDGLELVAE